MMNNDKSLMIKNKNLIDNVKNLIDNVKDLIDNVKNLYNQRRCSQPQLWGRRLWGGCAPGGQPSCHAGPCDASRP